MTVATDLAAFASSTSWEQIPDDARRALSRLVLDTLGCAVGAMGSDGPVRKVRAMVDELGGAPTATLIGGGRTSPDRAALCNGAAARYLDFNDTFLAAREACHPSDSLAPVLAATEHAGGDGRTLLTALATAYQVHCRLTDRAPVRAQGFDHTTQGVYGVAAGVARALGLDAERTANAVCIAGTPFNALRVTRTGQLSNWKGLAFPMAASNGTQAAFLAAHGVTGPAEVFEGAKGFMDAISGPFEVDWAAEPLDVVTQVLVKRYNAEVHSQSAIEGILALQAEHGFDASEVERVDVEAFDACFNIIGGGDEGDKHDVRSKEAADHSLPYILAVALLDGGVMPPQYLPGRLFADDVQGLLRRVHVTEAADLTERYPDEMPVRLEVTLTDGRRLSREQADYEGFPTQPMAWETVVAKFRGLAEPVAGPAICDALVEAVAGLAEADSVAGITEPLSQVATNR